MSAKYQDTKDKYLKEKVEEFKIRVPKGEKSIFQAQAKASGKSLNAYVVDLLHAAQDSKKEIPPATENSEASGKVSRDQLIKALYSLGMISWTESLSEDDLRFLSVISVAIDGWFSSK